MGFRFRRRIKIAPGIYINVGKDSVSVSAGVRGAHVTVGPKGVTRSVGIPGTGLSHTETDRWGTAPERALPTVTEIPTDAAPALAPLDAPKAPRPFYSPSVPAIDAQRRVRRYNVAIAIVVLAIVTLLAWPYIVRLLAGE